MSGRDLRKCVDRFGNISVDVTIGSGPGAEEWTTGGSAGPATIAGFLRDLADDMDTLIPVSTGTLPKRNTES